MRKLNQIYLKAGLLPFTIAISLIISIICGAMIMVLYYYNLVHLMYKNDSRLINNLESAREYILASGVSNYPEGEIVSVDLFGSGQDSVQILRKRWGCFNLFETYAITGKQMKSEIFLSGKSSLELPETVLFLADNNQIGLTLIGITQVNGNAYLPSRGVKPGYLNHQTFLGRTLINGEIETSTAELPVSVSDAFLSYYQSLRNISNEIDILDETVLKQSELFNRFSSLPLYIFSEFPIVITNKIAENIIVSSKVSVEITSSAQLDNIIIAAPNIKINTGFSGNAQVFAWESIQVEDNVNLLYPSALVCCNSEGNYIYLGRNSILEGGVYLIDTETKTNDWENINGNIIINESFVHGQVFSSGNIEISGIIYGQTICNKINYRDRMGKLYTNYLVDCTLDITKVSELFLYPDIFDNNCTSDVLMRLL